MAYDAESDRVILFGGEDAMRETLGDTWAYDFNSNTWLEMGPTTSPPPRAGHGMTYDAQSDRVVVFGGFIGTTGGFNDTWTYDFNTNTWTRMTPPTSPSIRWGNRLAYDSESDRTIMLGGHFETPTTQVVLFNDTWAYDVNADSWTKRDPIPGSTVANWHGMVYDAESDRVIRFGGDTGVGLTAETLAYDFNGDTWTFPSPPTRPLRRWFHAMAYDQGSDRVVLFGGSHGENQTWVYDFNADVWTQRNPMVRPSGRLAHAMAYDAESDRVILFGGDRDLFVDRNNETWAYDDDTETWTPLLVLPAAPSDLQAAEGDGRVELSWSPPMDLGSPPASTFGVYRASTTEPFSLVDAVTGLAFVDVNVTNGVEYFYHTTAMSDLGEGPRSNVVPATPADVTSPVVVITSPNEGATLINATITVTGTALDNNAVERVEISADAAAWLPTTGTASWTGTLTLAEGLNTIHARVFDTSGNPGSTSVSVLVQLTPSPPPPPDPLLLALIAAAIGGAGIGAFLLVRRSRRREP